MIPFGHFSSLKAFYLSKDLKLKIFIKLKTNKRFRPVHSCAGRCRVQRITYETLNLEFYL